MEFEPVWGVPIAMYLFLAGLGGGAFITSAFSQWMYPESATVRKIGRLIAPVAVAVGLVLLMFDAKAGFMNPLRFALLLHNPFSVMTWGVVFLAVFEVIALVSAIFEIRNKTVPRWLNRTGVAFGFAVAAYTGVLLGVVKTFPLWNNSLLPVLFVVSALSTGAASVMLGSLFVCRSEFERMWNLKKVHFFLPVIELALICALLFITGYVSVPAHDTVASLLSGRYALAFWLGLITVGLVVPTCIEAYPIYVTKRIETGSTSKWLSIGGECGVLIGGFLLRLLIILAALPVTIVS